MTWIDLTHTFTDTMPVWPGDAASRLKRLPDHEGIVHYELKTGLHVGTHIDAPLHMVKGGKSLSDFEPEYFMGRAYLLDVRGHAEIGADLLKNHSAGQGDILLVLTGHSKKFGREEYYQSYPVVTEDFAREVIRRGIKIVGFDTPSPDREPYLIHKLWLPRDILIIENLNNLESLIGVASFEIMALPPKLEAEAALVRVIARVL